MANKAAWIYLVQRLFQAIPVLLIVLTLNFVLVHAAPGDPVLYMYGSQNLSPEDLDRQRKDLGLDRPLWEQYVSYMKGLAHGDLGYSAVSRRKVFDLIMERLPATLLLTVTSLMISLVLGVAVGVIAAVRAHSWFDYGLMAVAVAGYSMPVFWLGLMAMLFFSVYLGWFPTMGLSTLGDAQTGLAGLLDVLHHMVLPVVVLSLYYMATYARLTRTVMLEVLQTDYIRTARAKGLPEWRVQFRHALKNALLPVLTTLGLQVGFLFTGAVLTETVFAWPGLGRLTQTAVFQRDYPLLMGLFVIVTIAVLAVSVLTDMVYGLVDPRISYREVE